MKIRSLLLILLVLSLLAQNGTTGIVIAMLIVDWVGERHNEDL